MNILKKIAWVSSIIIPLAFCLFLYKTYNGDYDSNFTFLIPSIFICNVFISELVLSLDDTNDSSKEMTAAFKLITFEFNVEHSSLAALRAEAIDFFKKTI